jgi:hypothetical protein
LREYNSHNKDTPKYRNGFDRKIAMRLRNTKMVLKAPNEIDFNRINPK